MEKYNIVYQNKEIEEKSLNDIINNFDYTIIYFYPKDNTPGCSVEAEDFSEFIDNFKSKNINVLWVSKDSSNSHKNFIEKKGIKFPLISDSELILHNHFWAYGEKKSFWKTTTWTIRSTFIVDNKANLIKEWKNVKAKWHAEKVFNWIEENL